MYSRFVEDLYWRAARSRSLQRSLLAASLIVLLSGPTACNRFSSSGTAARDDLSLVPKDSAALFMLNLKQARGTRVFQKIIEARDKDPNSAKGYRDFVQKCNLDPVTDLDSLFLAVPANAQQSREYTLILRGRYQPEAIAACVRKSAAERGQTPQESDYNGVHILGLGDKGPQLAVLAKRAIVIAGSDSIRRVIDLHTGKLPVSESARDNKELAAMLARTHTSDAFWWIGQVPSFIAERLRGSPQFGAAASLHSISGSVDIGTGVAVHADLDLGSDADATALHGSVTNELNNLRQDSRLALIGMTGYVDTITVAAKKSTFVADIKLNEKQLDDLTNRLSGLARSIPSF
jgi:hypothetical protein